MLAAIAVGGGQSTLGQFEVAYRVEDSSCIERRIDFSSTSRSVTNLCRMLDISVWYGMPSSWERRFSCSRTASDMRIFTFRVFRILSKYSLRASPAPSLRLIDKSRLPARSLVHTCRVLPSWLLPSKSLVKFPAWECCFQNDISVLIEYEWHRVQVILDRHNEYPLPRASRMLDDIPIPLLQDQGGKSSSNEIPRPALEPGVLFFIPDNVHMNPRYHIMYTMSIEEG
jgi:hypothetical protein